MPTISGGIGIALQALLANSQQMQVIEHNIANANTPGYRRQSAILMASASQPANGSEYGNTAGQWGGGVVIDKIQRFNLQYFDGRFRSVSAEAKNWESQSNVLGQYEVTMAESSSDGLLPKLDEFWGGWQSLSTDPTSNSLRANLLDTAGSLVNAFTRRYEMINQMRNDQNLAVVDQVDRINSLATEVASLNTEITHVESVGEQANDLLDRRDNALDELAKLSGATSSIQKNGAVTVSIGGHMLVVGQETFKMVTKTNYTIPDVPVQDVYWADTLLVNPASGELKGTLDIRDKFLVGQQEKLDVMAAKLKEVVNAVHASGYDPTSATGAPEEFFTGSGAGDIAVNINLINDPRKIATADAADQAGNNVIALKISALKYSKVLDVTGAAGDSLTLNEFYNGEVTNRSIVTRRASDSLYQNNLVVQALGNQRESVAGVSLDEEAANMAKVQKAYQAAARVLTAYDEMLDVVINRMGLVGR